VELLKTVFEERLKCRRRPRSGHFEQFACGFAGRSPGIVLKWLRQGGLQDERGLLADDAVCSEKAVAIPIKRAHREAMHKVGRKPLTKRIVA
jgi:hypothetical protein